MHRGTSWSSSFVCIACIVSSDRSSSRYARVVSVALHSMAVAVPWAEYLAGTSLHGNPWRFVVYVRCG